MLILSFSLAHPTTSTGFLKASLYYSLNPPLHHWLQMLSYSWSHVPSVSTAEKRCKLYTIGFLQKKRWRTRWGLKEKGINGLLSSCTSASQKICFKKKNVRGINRFSLSLHPHPLLSPLTPCVQPSLTSSWLMQADF